MLKHFMVDEPEFGQDARSDLLKMVPKNSTKAIGYRSACDPDTSYLSFNGIASKIVQTDTIIECHGPVLFPIAKTFHTITQTLGGVELLLVIDGELAEAPATNKKVEQGTDEHAHEICATLTPIADDIFAANDDGMTYIVVCADADYTKVDQLLSTSSV